jgi:glycosyltransferase involved in cell wall biosynthesis
VVREGRPAGPPTVVLSGNLGYRPTVRAARWFADRVWPGVRERVPSARWVLAGARPAAAIRRLASRPGIDVRGDVADLGRELRQATVAVAPMASGSGVAIKMLEAMAAGVAVVADPWSAAGLEDPAAVAVAVDEKGWVDTVSLLLSDVVAMRDQAQRGTELWRDHYEPGRVALKIREAVAAALEGDR